MSYSPDITIGTDTYSLQSQRTNASVRSDAAQEVSEPNLLTISHENAKNGRRSSVVILDDTNIVSSVDATIPVADTIRTMFKVQYNPLGGRTDNETTIKAEIAKLVIFLGDVSNIDKMLNQET